VIVPQNCSSLVKNSQNSRIFVWPSYLLFGLCVLITGWGRFWCTGINLPEGWLYCWADVVKSTRILVAKNCVRFQVFWGVMPRWLFNIPLCVTSQKVCVFSNTAVRTKYFVKNRRFSKENLSLLDLKNGNRKERPEPSVDAFYFVAMFYIFHNGQVVVPFIVVFWIVLWTHVIILSDPYGWSLSVVSLFV
jgi:hypothetical protein